MRIAMFLRGINVGGIRVPMEELRVTLEGVGLNDVKTYLQTGNILFTTKRNLKTLEPVITKVLSDRFRYEAHALLLSHDVLQPIVAAYPFETPADKHRYVVFCRSAAIVKDLTSAAEDLERNSEQVAAGPNVIYWEAPKGQSTDTPFSKLLAKPRYKTTTTTRNLNTLEKMIDS